MSHITRRLNAAFYQTENGNEPVREWLKSLSKNDKKIIGEDIKTVQFGWPLGMPFTEDAKIRDRFSTQKKTTI